MAILFTGKLVKYPEAQPTHLEIGYFYTLSPYLLKLFSPCGAKTIDGILQLLLNMAALSASLQLGPHFFNSPLASQFKLFLEHPLFCFPCEHMFL